MAKEMMIIFVYDTSSCREEHLDPAEAVMYFHPAWVSPTQRLALVGQLIGVHHFLSTTFSSPKMISLQGGKFRMKKFGRYVLAVGTDHNIQDWILERRSHCLESILRLFHCDLETISQSFNNDRNKFAEKLHQMLETYLPILQYSANLFSNMPMMKLPTTVSNVFLESIQILRFCQETPGVLGGAIFFNNKVVATQLSAELTKQLVMTDPHRIRNPADRITTDFHLPVGVQLLRVFIQCRRSQEFTEGSSSRSRTTYTDTLTRRVNKKSSLPTSLVKRDTSKIFTVLEEGEADNCMNTESSTSKCPPSLPTRTKFDYREFKPKLQNPLTPSVCSTPLKDVNRVLHGTAVSICSANEETEQKSIPSIENNFEDIPDIVKEAMRCKRLNKLINGTRKKTNMKGGIERNKSSSLSNLGHMEEWLTVSRKDQSQPDLGQLRDSMKKKKFNTITDPCFPVFKRNGSPVSRTFYDHEISMQYLTSNDKQRRDSLKSRDSGIKGTLKVGWEIQNGVQVGEFDKFTTFGKTDGAWTETISPNMKCDEKKSRETNRRSMSLPLKSLNAPASDDYRRKFGEGVPSDILSERKLQLTPLMSKLSLLATDEKNGDLYSRGVSPSEFCGFSTFSSGLMTEGLGRKVESSDEDKDDFSLNGKENVTRESCSEKAELFICGQFSMVMILLMEDGTANNPELIHNLWGICMKHLERLGSQLQHCFDPLPSSGNKEMYSILTIDPHWDTLHRSGLWGIADLDIVSSLHHRFIQSSNLTDVIVRTDNSVIYGSQCGKFEVFYQQAMPPKASGSLPTPADLMGVVPLKAKRRLERDHGIVIL